MMAGEPGRTFGEQIRMVSTSGAWIDCSFLLALACVFNVDIIIFQNKMEPTLLGCSMLGMTPLAAIPIAMVNDMHFWGLRPTRVMAPAVQPQNGDDIAFSRKARKEEAIDDLAARYDRP